MKNITRVTSIAKKNGKSIQEAVAKLIYNYNRRPHATTGEIPLKVMLGRDNFDQLPSTEIALKELQSDDEELDQMLIRDLENKQKGKKYSDARNHARPTQVKTGDTVVVKNNSKIKLAPNFGSREFEVIAKKGEELLLKDRDGASLKQNGAHVKKLPEETESGKPLKKQSSLTNFLFFPTTGRMEQEPERDADTSDAIGPAAPEAVTKPEAPPLRRSTRKRRLSDSIQEFLNHHLQGRV